MDLASERQPLVWLKTTRFAMVGLANDRNSRAPLRLLSLDGGGVRGLSSLMVLEDLMESIMKEEQRLKIRPRNDNTIPKPCDYFDLIGGTSTGGIIAILLGRLRLDVRRCIEIYSELSQEIFRNDRSLRISRFKLPTGPTRFSGQVLEKSIKEFLRETGYDENEMMWDGALFEEVEQSLDPRSNIWADNLEESPSSSRYGNNDGLIDAQLVDVDTADDAIDNGPTNSSADLLPSNTPNRRATWKMRSTASVHRKKGQQGCRAFVVTSLKNALGLPRIISTYDPNDRGTKIWEALRATTAAPTLLPEISFGTPKMTYLDGGMGFNNPTAEVDYAAKSIWEGRPIGVIVSIGTGLQTIPAIKKSVSWLPFGLGVDISIASALASMSTGTARVDNEMKRMCYATNTRYFRFDVDGGLHNISLEQWMREDEMASLTEQYMRDPRQMRRAKDLGKLMVKLSALPPTFEIRPTDFKIGMRGDGLSSGAFKLDPIDFRTGATFGVKVRPADLPFLERIREISPSGLPGQTTNTKEQVSSVLPIAQDLDHDGKREEAIVVTCVEAQDICMRVLRTGIPAGKYVVKFIVCFFETRYDKPVDLVFSVGRPYSADNFVRRFVDARIAPDIVPVLLHPDTVRVRVSEAMYKERNKKSWLEVRLEDQVEVGLDGCLGFVINRRFSEGDAVGGWSFGGVRLEPIFDTD